MPMPPAFLIGRRDALSWANAKGLITGMTSETIVPQGDATRAQLAAILERFLAE